MAVKINKIFLLFVLILSAVLVSIFAVPTYNSYASILIDGIEYSTVLEDLQSDSSFNVESYPLKEKDYSLQVIQIAESENKELFIYTYQPSGEIGNLTATSINISTGIEENLNYKNYKLSLLNSSGTLYKYKVKDFVVKDDALRYYDISSIFRNWNGNIDEETENDNEITEVPYEVAKLYTAVTVNGIVSYTCKDTDIIEVIGKYAGFLRYNNSVIFNSTWTDAHFVAFSTNYEIDNLIEAKVSYVETLYKRVGNGLFQESTTEILDGPYDREVSFTADDEGDLLVNNSWFPHNYSFKRIISVSEFKEIEDLTSSASENLEGMQWVLRFAETERKGGYDNTTDGATWYDVSNVTILMLKFETNGVVYNLGVVDNKQSGDDVPDNVIIYPWLEQLLIILSIILGIIVIVLFFPVIKFLIVCLWNLLSFPFKLIKSIFKKRDKK